MDPISIEALRVRKKLSHYPSLQATVDDEAQAEELRETRFYLHYFLALPSKQSLVLGNINTHQFLNRHPAAPSLVPRSPCSSLLVASPHPYSSRAEVNNLHVWQ